MRNIDNLAELLTNTNALICAFCEEIQEDNASYCEPCFEYKGLMTVEEYLQEFHDLEVIA